MQRSIALLKGNGARGGGFEPSVRFPSTWAVIPLSKYGHSAVIVVKPVASFEGIPGVTLVPLPDGRALISLDETMTVYEFELKLRDVLEEEAGRLPLRDRKALAAVADILRRARNTKGISVHCRSIIVLKSTQRGRVAVATLPGTIKWR
jgi:hypothetical protein